jgi:uncharacterized membrane-anchored protein
MMKQMRGTRVSLKTTILVIVLALIVWALVVFVNVRDFVPEELQTSGQVEP